MGKNAYKTQKEKYIHFCWLRGQSVGQFDFCDPISKSSVFISQNICSIWTKREAVRFVKSTL